jgi:thiamine transporter ThiT
MNLMVGLYFFAAGADSGKNALAFTLGMVTLMGLASFIACNIVAISLRVRALSGHSLNSLRCAVY